MSSSAIPARHSDIEQYVSTESAVDPLLQGQFVVVSSTSVARAAASEPLDVIGICDMDQVDGEVAVYVGADAVKAPGASANTLAIHDDVYVAALATSPNEPHQVFGEPEAAANAAAIGKVVEVLDGGDTIVFRPFWLRNLRGPDAA